MGLNEADVKVFKAIYQKALEKDSDILSSKDLGISEIDLTDSLEMLNRYRYVDLSLSTVDSATIIITPTGFYNYARLLDKAVYALFGLVADQIINKKKRDSIEIAESLNISALAIKFILYHFKDVGELDISELMGGRIVINNVGVGLKREYQKSDGA